MIGEEDQLIIDVCGTAVTNLLTILAGVHREANVPLPYALGVQPGRENG